MLQLVLALLLFSFFFTLDSCNTDPAIVTLLFACIFKCVKAQYDKDGRRFRAVAVVVVVCCNLSIYKFFGCCSLLHSKACLYHQASNGLTYILSVFQCVRQCVIVIMLWITYFDHWRVVDRSTLASSNDTHAFFGAKARTHELACLLACLLCMTCLLPHFLDDDRYSFSFSFFRFCDGLRSTELVVPRQVRQFC